MSSIFESPELTINELLTASYSCCSCSGDREFYLKTWTKMVSRIPFRPWSPEELSWMVEVTDKDLNGLYQEGAAYSDYDGHHFLVARAIGELGAQNPPQYRRPNFRDIYLMSKKMGIKTSLMSNWNKIRRLWAAGF